MFTLLVGRKAIYMFTRNEKKGNKILSFKKRNCSCNIVSLNLTPVSIFYKRVGRFKIV